MKEALKHSAQLSKVAELSERLEEILSSAVRQSVEAIETHQRQIEIIEKVNRHPNAANQMPKF